MTAHPVVLKRCRICGESKPLDAFNQNSARVDGKSSFCRTCQKTRQQAHYRANAPAIKAKQVEARRKDPAHSRAIRKRSAAKTAATLSDAYVRKTLVLTGFPEHAAAHPKLIELKRVQLAIKRQLKSVESNQAESGDD